MFGKGKVFAANSEYTHALSLADDSVITPLIYSEAYIPFILDYCKVNGISVVISLFDIDLPILSKNQKLFAEHNIKLIVSDFNVINICNDKWLTFSFLKENDIATPLTFIDKTQAIGALDSGKLNYPVIMKPRWGMGSIGIYKADNLEELEVLYRKISNEINNSYLKYEAQADVDNSILIQQCITGAEYGIEVVNDLNKNYVATLCKKKVSMRSGETDQAITVDDEHLKSIGMKLSSKLKHIAMLDVDCLEENDDFYVLELNARFGGQYPFSHLAGANIPKQIVDWLYGGSTEIENCSVVNNVASTKNIQPVLLCQELKARGYK